MQNKDELLNQIIDNLTLIKNSKSDFSQIEKDIVLQNLREAYLLILRNQVSSVPTVQKPEINPKPETEKKEMAVMETKPTVMPVQPVSLVKETPAVEKSPVVEKKVEPQVEVPRKEEKPVVEKISIKSEKPQVEDLDEMDSDILQFLTPQPKVETKSQPVVKTEAKVEAKPEPKPEVKPEPKPEVKPVPKPEVKPEPKTEVKLEVKPEVKQVDSHKVTVSEPKMEIPEIKPKVEEPAKSEPKPTMQEDKQVVVKPEAKPAIPEPKPAQQVEVVPAAEKPQQRSLNDLFNEQKRENSLGDKFQQKKVVDLTKAMTINDKFLFIRELFKNKSEEFSRAIQTLNNCQDIEEAFDIMEGLKKQYFWDSTSSAYLSLCDLVRRKF